MALRWKAYAPNTILRSVEVQDLADNGVVQLDTAADLASADLVNANVTYVVAEAKPYVRIAAGVGADKWQVFSGGLAGLGGWADVTATTGSPTKHEYTDADGNDWTAYEFTGDGTVTVSDGLVDALIVGGGAGTSADGSIRGSGGGVITGVRQVEVGDLTVVVGAGGPTTGAGLGAYSQLGPVRIGGGSQLNSPNGYQRGSSGGFYAGAGSAGDGQGRTTGGIGVTSSLINGTPVMYASGGGDYRAPADDRPGDGGHGDNQPNVGYGLPGVAGIVAIRVPRENAKA